MKGLKWVGSSLEAVRRFPRAAPRAVGHELDRVRPGLEPTDWRPMKTIGAGVREIRIREDGIYRIIDITQLANAA
jgi:phage-related protein